MTKTYCDICDGVINQEGLDKRVSSVYIESCGEHVGRLSGGVRLCVDEHPVAIGFVHNKGQDVHESCFIKACIAELEKRLGVINAN